MGRIETALATNPFRIDESQCLLLAERLTTFRPADARYPWSDFSRDAQICFKVFFVSVCHQINWDFLQNALFNTFAINDAREMIRRAGEIRPATIQSMLGGYHRPDRVRGAERARYLRSTSAAISASFDGNIEQLVCSNKVLGEGGLFERLRQVPAFAEDPLSKKSNALAQELAREGIVDFIDASKIPPAIDYHLIRLYLRTGRVYASNEAVFSSLSTGQTHRPRLLRLLREATAIALSTTAEFAKLPIHELNYLEWQLGRSRCERDFVNCNGEWPSELKDESITKMSAACPMRENCHAYKMPRWKSLIEPALHLKKAYY